MTELRGHRVTGSQSYKTKVKRAFNIHWMWAKCLCLHKQMITIIMCSLRKNTSCFESLD